MSKLSVTLSANAGISLSFGGAVIWIDALHSKKVPGFSTVDPALQQKIFCGGALSPPDVICFTHCHEDHYSRGLTEQAQDRWPGAQLILPRRDFARQTLLQGDDVWETVGGLTLHFFRTVHDGKEYVDVPHYGLLLSDGNHRILIAGDSALAEPRLAQVAGEAPVDTAVLNFPWITLRRGREFVKTCISPRYLCVYHLPFAEDDLNGYRDAARRGATLLPDVQILDTPLQRAEIHLEE